MIEKKKLESVSHDDLEAASGGIAPLIVGGALVAGAIAYSFFAPKAHAPSPQDAAARR